MSPLIKAIGVGLATLVGALVLMWLVARILHRPFLPLLPGRAPTPTPSQLIDLAA